MQFGKTTSKRLGKNHDFCKTSVKALKIAGKIASGLVLVSLTLQVQAGAADLSLNQFCRKYPLNPVRGYTFLGTEKSTYHVDSLYQEFNRNLPGVPVNKPCVLPDGRIDAWFNPGEHISWVTEAMKTGHYDFSLVDGYLPAVRYVYHNEGTKLTCEMTTFAVDGEAPGSIFIHVSLVEKDGAKDKSAQYFKLGTKSPSTKSEFDAALQGLRKHWEAFFASGSQIPIPDPAVLNASKASIIRALITYTGDNPHYGVVYYGHSMHDGFPPTTIALVHCLLDWGQTSLAFRIITNYFDDFISPEGEILYYGPSIEEYGQLLWLTRLCMDAGASQEWLEYIRPKLEAIRQRLWTGQAEGPSGLIYGGPEADRRIDAGVYFHNNAWAWRGLRDIAPILGHAKEDERCKAFKNTILEAIEKVTDRSGSIPFIPPMAEKTEFNIMTPFDSLTPGDFESYTNYRYWPELMSSGILSREQMQVLIDYRKNYRGEIAGMTRFWGHADNWPIAEYAMGLMDLGKTDEVKNVLYSHLAGHMTPETWTAYEQVDIKGSPYRKIKADYCVPAQLVAPRLAAWLWGKSSPLKKAYNIRNVKPKSIQVDGKLDENAWTETDRESGFALPWEVAAVPSTEFLAVKDDKALYFAFDVCDNTLVVEEKYGGEMTITREDRVEVYFACDDSLTKYYCIEIDPLGRVLDYSASHYRNFDYFWSFEGIEVSSKLKANGYTVECSIPLAELKKLGLPLLQDGTSLKVGLFRADLRREENGRIEEHWLSWANPSVEIPDYHIPSAFGVLMCE